jgi:hypothetical protein
MTLFSRVARLSAALAVLSLTISLSAAAGCGSDTKPHFDKPQTPVAVDGKPHYGSCADCTPKLQNARRAA